MLPPHELDELRRQMNHLQVIVNDHDEQRRSERFDAELLASQINKLATRIEKIEKDSQVTT